jgi:hypothetical protein
MNSDDVISQAEANEQVLTFDIPDDVLEQTASAEHTAFTLVYCTNTATCPTVRPLTRFPSRSMEVPASEAARTLF